MPKYRYGQTIDVVVNNPTYGKHLEADLVERSHSWWGEINNRWPQTRGHYIRVLVAEKSHAGTIFKILKSFQNRTDWNKARRYAGTKLSVRNEVKKIETMSVNHTSDGYQFLLDLLFYPKGRQFVSFSHTGANSIFCIYLAWVMGGRPLYILCRATDCNNNSHTYRSLYYCTCVEGVTLE